MDSLTRSCRRKIICYWLNKKRDDSETKSVPVKVREPLREI